MLMGVTSPVRIGIELGPKRTFAWALDWPGWCRSGRSEQAAIEALARYAPRYLPVAAAAGESLPAGLLEDFEVVERLSGSMSTDFGVPAAVGASDAVRLTSEAGARMAALLAGAGDLFDRVVAGAPTELRKGPRGGGRDRDPIVDHVQAGELIYARKLGLRLASGAPTPGSVAALRESVGVALRAPKSVAPMAKGWPPRYYARRAAWHLLDHAWEIQDRSPTD